MNKAHDKATKNRQEHELPKCITEWGWKYHHLGLPTKKKMPNEKALPKFKLYHSGFNTSPYGIEWMRYGKGSSVNKKVQKLPHIAFEVKDLNYELTHRSLKIITKPNSPGKNVNVRVAMVEHNGAVIELIEFKRKR